MKKIIMVLIFSFFVSSVAYAHPPQDIRITYDSKTKILTALIMHNVSDVKKHYIAKVDIGLNGRQVISHAISQQDSNVDQKVSYLIPDAKRGDKISIEAHCYISGRLEKEIIVPK